MKNRKRVFNIMEQDEMVGIALGWYIEDVEKEAIALGLDGEITRNEVQIILRRLKDILCESPQEDLLNLEYLLIEIVLEFIKEKNAVLKDLDILKNKYNTEILKKYL